MGSGVEVTVRVCIGCGAIDTPQPCLGTCVERRLDLIPADVHEQALAALDDTREALTRARALVCALAESAPEGGEALYRRLQLQARAAARRIPAVPEDARVTTWECMSCGRIEAPQPCIGVCIKPPARMIRAGEHDRVLAQLDRARREAAPLVALVRLLAWATPRAGQWERGLVALRRKAEGLAS
jgi:hypothetical protein